MGVIQISDKVVFFLMIRRPPRSTQSRSSAASDVYKRQDKMDINLTGTVAANTIQSGYSGYIIAAAGVIVGATITS